MFDTDTRLGVNFEVGFSGRALVEK